MKRAITALLPILIVACVSPPTEPPGTAQPVTVEPTTQDSDGIQAAIDYLPTAGGIVLLKAGLWDMDADAIPSGPNGQVLLRDNMRLQCEPGANIEWSGASWGLLLQGSGFDNFTIDGCTFTINVDCDTVESDDGCRVPPSWATNTNYSSVGYLASNGGSVYRVAVNGVSATTGTGPSGTGTGITDGSVTWDYVGNDNGTPVNYLTAIEARGVSNVRITNNTFKFGDSLPMPTDTMMAFLGSGDDVIIENNTVHHMQIKAGVATNGGGVRRNLRVAGNTFHRPFNYAISVVSQDADEGWDGIDISNNVISDPGSNGGIYVGADGEPQDCARLTGLTIADNILRGEWGTNTKGILVRSCETSSGWNVTGNTLDNDGPLTANYGMRVNDNQQHPTSNVVIANNVVGGSGGFDLHGIMVGTEGDSWVVANNVVDGARGMSLTLGGDGYMVNNNIIKSQSHGLDINAMGSGFTNALIADNLISTQAPWTAVVHRDDGASLTFGARFQGNLLVGGTNVTLWGGDSVGTCVGNSPSDC